MSPRGKKLGRLLSVASAEERRSLATFGQARQKLEAEIRRLGELEGYRRDYADSARSMSQVASNRWQDYQAFMNRLGSAIAAQHGVIARHEAHLETCRQRWMTKRRRVDAMQRVVDRRERAEQDARSRREQRQMDDLPSPGDKYSGD